MAFNKIKVANPVVEMDGKQDPLAFSRNRSAGLIALSCASSLHIVLSLL